VRRFTADFAHPYSSWECGANEKYERGSLDLTVLSEKMAF
jgi:hypothetical protein